MWNWCLHLLLDLTLKPRFIPRARVALNVSSPSLLFVPPRHKTSSIQSWRPVHSFPLIHTRTNNSFFSCLSLSGDCYWHRTDTFVAPIRPARVGHCRIKPRTLPPGGSLYHPFLRDQLAFSPRPKPSLRLSVTSHIAAPFLVSWDTARHAYAYRTYG